jgi:hypothetical protein
MGAPFEILGGRERGGCRPLPTRLVVNNVKGGGAVFPLLVHVWNDCLFTVQPAARPNSLAAAYSLHILISSVQDYVRECHSDTCGQARLVCECACSYIVCASNNTGKAQKIRVRLDKTVKNSIVGNYADNICYRVHQMLTLHLQSL